MMPYVIEHGVAIQEFVRVDDLSKDILVNTGYSSRSNSFGYTWGHVCEYETIVFIAVAANGDVSHGFVDLPDRFDGRTFQFEWKNATEPSDATERE